MNKPNPKIGSETPILLFTVGSLIKASGGEVWHISDSEYGMTFRATMQNGKRIRVIVQAPGKRPLPYPEEKGVASHLVLDIVAFKAWLSNIVATA